MKVEAKHILIGLSVGVGMYLLYRKLSSKKDGGSTTYSTPAVGKVTSGFGYRIHPISGDRKFHDGIDIGIPSNTPLKAPMDGVVETSTYHSVAGNYVILKHPNGYKTGYLHLNKSLVKVGDKVKRGQVFALSGNTGGSTGAHLHLTITNPQGQKVDPKIYFKDYA